MKYYLYFDDDVFSHIYDIEEVRLSNENLYNKIMKENFGVGTWNELTLSYNFEYKSVYEIESNYTLEQLNKILVQDVYIDVLEIAKILGKVKRII